METAVATPNDGPQRSAGVAQRNVAFDLLRIIFALMVLLSHAAEVTDGDAHREVFSRLTHSGITFGTFGVDGFFLLSGYLILRSWQHDPHLVGYLRKRVLRIVPGYLVAALLSTVVVGWVAPAAPGFFHHLLSLHFVASVAVLSSPATPPVLPGNHYPLVDGALYTIAYEFRCYLLVALLGICGLLRWARVWLAITVVLALALVFVPSPAKSQPNVGGDSTAATTTAANGGYAVTPARLASALLGNAQISLRLTTIFFLGGCFQMFRSKIRFRPGFAAIALVLLVAVFVFQSAATELGLAVFGGYLMFYLGQVRMRALARLQRHPDVSYGVYLYGWPVEVLLIWRYHPSPWVVFAESAALCLALGWVSWHFVERPMLKLKTRPSAALPTG